MTGMVIIGAGECGTRAAFALREVGWSGQIALIGEEPGLPYERPPLSKPDGQDAPRRNVCDFERLATADIDYLPGERVATLDVERKTVSLRSGNSLSYKRLLLATGAKPRQLTCPGGRRAHVFRTIQDAKVVYGMAGPEISVVIIGAGLIGMELAACLRTRGAAVTVIEAARRPMARAVPAALARRLHDRHVRAGVNFVFGASISGIDGSSVVLCGEAPVPADVVVSAIGVIPDTALAEACGLATGNGILVDFQLRTSVPDIFAAGDCACLDRGDGYRIRYENWRSARDQGELAARNMAGAKEMFSTQPWFWSDQYDLGLQVVGLPSDELVTITRNLSNNAELKFFLDDDGMFAGAAGLGPGNSVGKEIRLAEMLIDARAKPDAVALADPATSLKSHLKAARAASNYPKHRT